MVLIASPPTGHPFSPSGERIRWISGSPMFLSTAVRLIWMGLGQRRYGNHGILLHQSKDGRTAGRPVVSSNFSFNFFIQPALGCFQSRRAPTAQGDRSQLRGWHETGGLKGRNIPAQGNALGTQPPQPRFPPAAPALRVRGNPAPEAGGGRGEDSLDAAFWNPGRCPGLVCCGPFGADDANVLRDPRPGKPRNAPHVVDRTFSSLSPDPL